MVAAACREFGNAKLLPASRVAYIADMVSRAAAPSLIDDMPRWARYYFDPVKGLLGGGVEREKVVEIIRRYVA